MSTRARPPLFAIKHSRTNAGSRLNFQAERQTAGQRAGEMEETRGTEAWAECSTSAFSGHINAPEIMIEAGRIYQCARVRC